MTAQAPVGLKRYGVYLLIALFPLAGIGAIWLGLSSLIPLIGAIRSGAPLIALSPIDMVGLPIGLAILAISAIGLTAKPVNGPAPRRRANAGKKRIDWAATLLAIGGVFVALAIFAAPIAELTVRSILEGRGYTQCPDVTASRKEPLRWGRGTPEQPLPCPRS